MMVIDVENVNQAFRVAAGIMLNNDNWYEVAPRNGKVTREFGTPVTTVYSRPWRRVLFCDMRDANPFFHLMEALWMMQGRDDVEWISQFTKNIAQFAEDDGHFHGAYGRRWQEPIDQLHMIGNHLRTNYSSRRAVLTMWNPLSDLNARKKDIPCNTHVYFKIRGGKLHMTVCCRSNDIIWGCYGANAVHFSVLQEYMAALVNCKIGTYYHVSDSWHYYVDNPTWKKLSAGAAYGEQDYYGGHGYTPSRIATTAIVNEHVDLWRNDLKYFFTNEWDDPTMYDDQFFRRTAYPMRDAWRCYKRGDITTALHLAKNIGSPDWSIACTQWLERRIG